MRINSVSSISYKANSPLTEGKKQFNQLTETQQAGLVGVEKFRQKYNSQAVTPLMAKDTPLAQYVRYKVCIENAMKKTIGNFKWPK